MEHRLTSLEPALGHHLPFQLMTTGFHFVTIQVVEYSTITQDRQYLGLFAACSTPLYIYCVAFTP